VDPRAQQLKELLADRFELVEFLGKGGFASVYRVRSLRLGRFEALKVLHKSADDDPEFGRRFRQEAMLAAALDHPSIVKIYDFGEAGGLFWYSMQLVDGPTLSRELRSRGRLPAVEAARLAIPVLDALEYRSSSTATAGPT
jgi:serine/threonine-protein kinase